jgi:hypothetical protein
MRAWKKWRGVRRVTEDDSWRRTLGGGGWMTSDSGRKVEKEDDMMGEGPMPVKPRVAEKDEVV